MTTSLSSEVLHVLDRSRVEGNILFLPDERLDRATYAAVNKAIEALGGKWNRKAQGHVFAVDASSVVDDAILTGKVTDTKKLYQFFETPSRVANKIVELADINEDCDVLEPSAGRGALLNAVLEKHDVMPVAVDIQMEMTTHIRQRFSGAVMTKCEDFMVHPTDRAYDRIVMNPPFTRQQDIEHVTKAYKHLKPSGVLVAVVSEGCFFRHNAKSLAFRSLLDSSASEVIDLEGGVFASAGTDVKTRIVKLLRA